MCLSPRRRPVAPAQMTTAPSRPARRGFVVPGHGRLRGAPHRIDHLLAEGLNAAMSEQQPEDDRPVTAKSALGIGLVTDERLLAA